MRAICLILIILLAACGCLSVKDKQPINHVVLVWFNEAIDDQYIHQVAVASQQLRRIPGVVEIRTGWPVDSDRPIVDDSFDLGVIIQFDSVEKMQSYVNDPIHKKFVEDYLQGNVEKLLVYDF